MSASLAADILATNMEAVLRRDTPKTETRRISANKWAKARGIEPKTIQRILKGAHATTLTVIEDVAAKANLQAWQMLYPGLDPSNPPVSAMTEPERQLYRRLKELSGSLPDHP